MKNILFLLLLAPLFLLGQNFPIGTSTFTYNDPARGGRTITGTVYYPATTAGTNTPVATGTFPIISFGHGFTVAVSEYQPWWDGLVPCGYIMIFPDTEGGLAPSHGDFGLDLSFLVDEYLSQNTNAASPFFGKLNGTAAVMGHSMGGGAAFLAAAGNTNISTIITLAAAETTPSAIAAAGALTIPSLTLAGSSDCVAPPANHQLLMYNAAPAYAAYLEIIDGSHCQFGLASAFSTCVLGEGFACIGASFIAIGSQHSQMLTSTKPWLDFHLKSDCTQLAIFQNYLTTSPNHTFMEKGTLSCCPTNLLVQNNVATGSYKATLTVTSDGVVMNAANVLYEAGNQICLLDGFTVPASADFMAIIGSCP